MDFPNLWNRLHRASKQSDKIALIEEFGSVMKTLRTQKKPCNCYMDAAEYMQFLLGNKFVKSISDTDIEFDTTNLEKLSQQGTAILFVILHNLVNLKLDKPVRYDQSFFV